jgi:hypothetical protein
LDQGAAKIPSNPACVAVPSLRSGADKHTGRWGTVGAVGVGDECTGISPVPAFGAGTNGLAERPVVRRSGFDENTGGKKSGKEEKRQAVFKVLHGRVPFLYDEVYDR